MIPQAINQVMSSVGLTNAKAAGELGMFHVPKAGFKGFYEGGKMGYGVGFKGNLPFFIAFGAYGAATAPRGHKLSAISGGGVGFGATAVLGGAIAGAFFGGDYRDTQTAVTMRQAAAREMSRSLVNARQWLGQEGAFMAQ
jgi:hypothetical protein